MEVPYTILGSEIQHIIFDVRKEKNPCSMCAKMRRGALHSALLERGIHKIALGHHYDDAVETFFMSLIFEGRLSCFQPVTWLDRTQITQIRPLLYCGENLVRHTARRLSLPVVENPCPANGNTKRQEIKELIYELQGRYPGSSPGSSAPCAPPPARVGPVGAAAAASAGRDRRISGKTCAKAWKTGAPGDIIEKSNQRTGLDALENWASLP